jgi:hypothetical protein
MDEVRRSTSVNGSEAAREQARADLAEHEDTYAWFASASKAGIVAAPLLLAFVLYWTT